MANRIWKLLNTDVRQLFAPETVTETATGAIETTKATMDLAKILQEQGAKVPELANILTDSSTLIGVLNSPLAQIFKESLPFVNIAAKLLAYYLEKTKQEPTLAECIVIVSQAAYLQSFNDFLKQSADLLQSIGETPVSEEVKQQIEGLQKLEISDPEARETAVCFHDSKLATELNQVLSARLQQAGLAKNEADILTQRVAWGTHRYMQEAWAQSEVATKHLAKVTFSDWLEQQEKYQSIDEYLQDEISPNSTVPEKLKRWQVFDEPFTISDIYVPLKAATVNDKGEIIKDDKNKTKEIFILQDRIKNILSDCDNPDDVIFIQAGPGRGKSVFCRKFADMVREHLHPFWTPILIRLRDLEHFDGSIDKILQNAIKYNFAQNDEWLTDKNTRFLFLLDGFDELRIEGRDSGGLKEFIEKVGKFQQNWYRQGHRIIITGRQLALQGISYLPPNLYRVEILAMDDEIKGLWFDKWEAIAAKYTEFAEYQNEVGKLRQLLDANNCPLQVKDELAREPLLLYLLGSLHRAGELKLEDFTNGEEIQTRIKIYEKSLEMVLTKQRGEDVQKRLIALDPEHWQDDLRRILLEAALCVIQSGSEYAKVETIKKRLEADQGAKNLIEKLRQNSGEQGLTTALAAFYLKPAAGKKGGGVEFFHKSFSEFLFAKKLLESLEDWTKSGMKREKYYVPDNQFYQEIYDLLGYGALTWEIVEYLMGLLISTQNFLFVALFRRLEDFYQRWCEGEFIDADPTNLPQQKRRKLKEELPEGLEPLGQRQIDIYTGLNVMILLLELHRYGQQKDDLKAEVLFYPCGKPDTEGKSEYPDRLLYVIGYSCCLGVTGFSNTIGKFLSGANVSGADLSGANLSGANLSGANLSGTDLNHANLSRANVSGANLSGANLSGANLSGTNVSGTDLSGANVSGANLSGANVSGANLNGANLSGANLNHANLSGANLSGAYLSRADLSGANLSGANLSGANLSGANLSGANLTHANLTHANLTHANLSGADLSGVDLSGANLSGAKLSVANLSGADLSGVDLSGANLSVAKLSVAKLSVAKLTRANVSGAYLSGAYLRRADLSGADLSGADLSGADLSGADLSGANLSRADLNGANLSVANLSGANLSGADLSEIRFSEETIWNNVQGLETALNVPQSLTNLN